MSMIGLGGLPRRRPDQQYNPSGQGVTPGARSIIKAQIVQIAGPSGGLFVYSPKAGHGNLVAVIAGQAGTDPYGNPYGKGISSIDPVFGGAAQLNGADLQLSVGLSVFAHLKPSGLFIYSPTEAAGNLKTSVTPASGTDPSGNAYQAGLTSYGTGQIAQVNSGQLRFLGGTITTPGLVEDFGGSMHLSSSQIAAGDTSASLNLLSKNESDDGLRPELVLASRVQVQDEVGNPSFVMTVNPNVPNADESPHAYGFAANFSQAAGRTPTQYAFAPIGLNQGGTPKGYIMIRGSIQVGAAAPTAGQAMTTGFGAGYSLAQGSSISMFNVTNSVAIRGFVTPAGIIQISGPVASVAAGDILDIETKLLYTG